MRRAGGVQGLRPRARYLSQDQAGLRKARRHGTSHPQVAPRRRQRPKANRPYSAKPLVIITGVYENPFTGKLDPALFGVRRWIAINSDHVAVGVRHDPGDHSARPAVHGEAFRASSRCVSKNKVTNVPFGRIASKLNSPCALRQSALRSENDSQDRSYRGWPISNCEDTHIPSLSLPAFSSAAALEVLRDESEAERL